MLRMGKPRAEHTSRGTRLIAVADDANCAINKVEYFIMCVI